jgi:metal-responsive CopG/Arc/MetJ family transcriptional regulator
MEMEEKKQIHRLNIVVDEELYVRLWNFIKAKYVSPWRVFSPTVREAIKEYLDRHESEVKSG